MVTTQTKRGTGTGDGLELEDLFYFVCLSVTLNRLTIRKMNVEDPRGLQTLTCFGTGDPTPGSVVLRPRIVAYERSWVELPLNLDQGLDLCPHVCTSYVCPI